MSVKVEATVAQYTVSPSDTMATLSAKTLDRKVAFKILEGVFPYNEYPGARSTLAAASHNEETVTVGTLFNVTLKLSPDNSDDHYTHRLIGRLSMENLGTYEDLQELSSEISKPVTEHTRKIHVERKETYHMRSCYCQFDDQETDDEDDS